MYNNQHMHSNELNNPQNAGSGSAGKKKDRSRDRDKSMRNSTTNLPNQTKVI